MRTLYVTTMLAMLLCACSSSGGAAVPEGDRPEGEEEAYEAIGDVRVYFYVKEMMVESAREAGTMVKQDELSNILVNKHHSLYRGEPEHTLPDEVRFLHDVDMYDLLYIFKTLGLFAKGNAVNIYGEDPVRRADRESQTTRAIAVEIIKDGKVNTSYFNRRINEHEADPDRARLFNDCQAVLLQAVAGSLPRGSAAYGSGDTRKIGRD